MIRLYICLILGLASLPSLLQAQGQDQNGASFSCDIVLGGDDPVAGRLFFAPGTQTTLVLRGHFMCRGFHDLDQGQFVRSTFEFWMSPGFWEDPLTRQSVVSQFDNCYRLALIAYNSPGQQMLRFEAGNVDIHPSVNPENRDELKFNIRYGPRANTLNCSLTKNLSGLQ